MISGYWLVKTLEDYLYYGNIVKSKSTVDANASSTVDANASSSVDANASSTVDARASSTVDARASSTVDASTDNKKECVNNYERMLNLFNTHLFNDNTIIE